MKPGFRCQPRSLAMYASIMILRSSRLSCRPRVRRRSILDGDFYACLHKLSAGHDDLAGFIEVFDLISGVGKKPS